MIGLGLVMFVPHSAGVVMVIYIYIYILGIVPELL